MLLLVKDEAAAEEGPRTPGKPPPEGKQRHPGGKDRRGRKGGRVEIEFYDEDDLRALSRMLAGE